MCAAAVTETLGLPKNRIEALADGVFATLMTVLVLGLALKPDPTNTPPPLLLGKLWEIRGAVFAYVMSFIVLGVYWVGHHNMFHYIKRTSRIFLWLNILFLLSVGLIPFSTSVFGAYLHLLDTVAIIFYGVNLMLAGGALFLVWEYATRNNLVDKNIDQHLVSTVKRRILTGPLLYLAAIAFSFQFPIVSVGLYVGALIFYILPGHIDLHFARKHD